MLAAAAHGVGSSIGWFLPSGAATMGDLLGISAERTVRTAISLGYPAEAADPSAPKPGQGRKSLGELVHLERYGQGRPAR
jgi:hypothetical protein